MRSCFSASRWGGAGLFIRQMLLASICSLFLWLGLSWGSLSAVAYAHHSTRTTHNSPEQSARATSPRSTAQTTSIEAVESVPPLMPPDMQRILDRGKLVVAVLSSNNPPFFMEMTDGQSGGLDIQLATAIATELGVDLELNRSADTFNGVVETVYNREADMAISKISRTMKRAKRVRFSHPYLQMRQGLLINRLLLAEQTNSDHIVETIRQLTGEVGVIKGSSYVGFLQRRFPQATIVERESWEDIVTAVSTGELLAGYRDELEIKKVVQTKPDAALQLKTAVLTDTQDTLAMVLPWDSTHLLAFANQYLDTLNTEYTADSILTEFADDLMRTDAAS